LFGLLDASPSMIAPHAIGSYFLALFEDLIYKSTGTKQV